MTADHTPCVLTGDCGPHCGLDRGYLGHCPDCHLGYGGGRFGSHTGRPSWLDWAERTLHHDEMAWMPDLSPSPG